jgi:hypothetical protein
MGDLNKAKMGREPKTTGRESPAPEQIKILKNLVSNGQAKQKSKAGAPSPYGSLSKDKKPGRKPQKQITQLLSST